MATTFKKNDKVYIHGLVKAKKLNKLMGIIVGKVEGTTRLAVMIPLSNKCAKIKAVNMSHATTIDEIESILQHLAKDQKCAFLRRFPGPLVPKSPIDPKDYLLTVMADPNGMFLFFSIYE